MMVMLEFKKGSNINWNVCDEWNRYYLQGSMTMFSNWLEYRGYVFLSEVLASMNYPITRYSITAGWKIGDSFKYELVDTESGFEIYLQVPHDDIRDIFKD